MSEAISDEELDFIFDEALLAEGQRHLARISALIERQRGLRLSTEKFHPRTEAERHIREHGHELAFGCCQSPFDDQRS